MRILVVGQGFIGTALGERFKREGHQVEFTAIPAFTAYPDLVVNAAGRKDLHWCEDNPYNTYADNTVLPVTLAEQLRGKCRFVHISSDHAYGEGRKTVYARSKRLADVGVTEADPRASVVITGHVYAKSCPWVKWLDEELRTGRTIIAHVNRVNRPTWIGHLAQVVLTANSGINFCTGRRLVNRSELFRDYAKAARLDENLIVDGICTDPLLIDKFDVKSDTKGPGPYEGFQEMLAHG